MNKHFYKFSAAAIVLNVKGEILLVKGRRGWEIPGGYVNFDESIEEAAIREVKEETGFTIEITHFCGVAHDRKKCRINFCFEGKILKGEMSKSEEHEEIGFFTIKEAYHKITWKNFNQRLKYWFQLKSPYFFEL